MVLTEKLATQSVYSLNDKDFINSSVILNYCQGYINIKRLGLKILYIRLYYFALFCLFMII